MEANFTDVVVIEELPTVQLFLLDQSQDSSVPICEGVLQICQIQVSSTFFLWIQPDFRYALSKQIQVLRAKDKRYIFPTNQQGVMYGLVVCSPVKSQVGVLDLVLEDNTTFIIHKQTLTDTISAAVTKSGSWLAKGFRKSASLAAAGYSKGKEKVSKMLDDRKERKKQAAREKIQAKIGQPTQQLPLGAVADMMVVSEAASATETVFAPETHTSLRDSTQPVGTQVKAKVSEVAGSVSGSVKSFADRVVQSQLGLRGTEDLVVGLKLLNSAATQVSKFLPAVDPATVLRVAASVSNQFAPQPRPS